MSCGNGVKPYRNRQGRLPDVLPRLKPDPIPDIHPVPEYLATGDLAKRYAQTKQGLDVPWMGVVAMAFAHYPNFYGCLWNAIAPVVVSQRFVEACQNLQDHAQEEANRFNPPEIVSRLEAAGYAQSEIVEIRQCNAIFSDGNMPYVLMASLARLLLEGVAWPSSEATDGKKSASHHPDKPTLIEAHHADPTVQALYFDIKETLGLPFVNTDYRAFARWPSYFLGAWKDLREFPPTAGYENAVSRIHERALNLALSLPNYTGISPQRLIDEASKDAELREILDVVRLFQWLLPGLAFNVAFFRSQLQPNTHA